jgi:hypothetical protein
MRSLLALVMAFSLAPQDDLKPGLIGEYYDLGADVEDFPDVKDLKPAETRVDLTINFPSTEGDFADTGLVDRFFVRWSGLLRVPAEGSYTFYLASDDGSRLFIDGKKVVDNGGLHGMEEQSGEAKLTAGDHEIKIEFFENGGGAGCQLFWEGGGQDRQIVPFKAFFHKASMEKNVLGTAPLEVGQRPGLLGEYFDMGDAVEDFPALGDRKPKVRRIDRQVSFPSTEEAFAGTDLAEHLYARWTGLVWIPKDGKYTFYTESDDGSRLSIDGKQVVDNGGLHGMEEKSGEAEIKAGWRELKLEFFENEGGAGCRLLFSGEGIPKRVIPARFLAHKEDPDLDAVAPGLIAEYFNIGEELGDFPSLEERKPAKVRIDPQVNFESTEEEFAGTGLSETFYARWTGLVKAPAEGMFTFYTESDDGSRLYIDGALVVDNGGLHGMEERSGVVQLRAGEHEIRIDFFENGGGAGCKASWEGPGTEKQIIPAGALLHRKSAESILKAAAPPAPAPK